MKNDKTNKKNDKKYKIVLRKIINIFCYVVTAISLFLGVLVGISQCSAKDRANLKLNKQYSFANTQLRSSFGNFDFIPYYYGSMQGANQSFTGSSRFGSYSNSYGYYDLFVVKPNSQTYTFATITSPNFSVGVSSSVYTIYYNGQRYSSGHIAIFGDHFTYYSTSTGYTVVYTNQEYFVAVAMYTQGTSHTLNLNIGDYRFNLHNNFIYYCSFANNEMNNLTGYTEDSGHLLDGVSSAGYCGLGTCEYIQQNLNFDKVHENYDFDDDTYVLNPFKIPDSSLSFRFPTLVRQYYDQSYDETLDETYINNGISYSSNSFYLYSYYDVANEQYYGSNMPLAEVNTSHFGLTYLDIGRGFSFNKSDSPWFYCFYYYVITFRGYFPILDVNANYKDYFISLDVSAIQSNITFTVNSESIMYNYQALSGEAGTMKNLFRGSSFLYLTSQVFTGFTKNAQWFNYMYNYDVEKPLGLVTTIGKPNVSQLRKVSTNRIDINDLLFFLDSSYDVEFLSIPIEPDIDAPDTLEVISETFNLFSMAFTSMVAFFNFKIGATLTLGTLILIPLIATLIFFIVRLFKR